MKNTIGKKIAVMLLVIGIVLSVTALLYAATIEKTEIVCTDNNLYNALKSRLSRYSISTDNTNKTITIPTDNLIQITELDLSNSQITNLTGIQQFSNLTNLNLSRNTITDLSPIANLNQLQILNISGNRISSAIPLANKVELIELNVSNTGMSDLTFASNLTNLQILDASNNTISDLSTIENLSKITKLNVSNNKNLVTLQFIIKHYNLVELDVSNSGITNLEGIESLRNLESLNVGNLSVNSLTPIVEKEKPVGSTQYVAKLEKLKKLDIRYTKAITFGSLSILQNLEELYMQGNEISSLTGIVDLEKLQYMNLEDNKISNINTLVTWKTVDGQKVIDKKTNATQIILKKNAISDIAVFQYLPQDIQYLDLSENKISEISPLEGNSFSLGLHLENQKITFPIYKKKVDVAQYIILPTIIQRGKNQNSIMYDANVQYTTEGVSFHTQEIYQQAGNYNIIIEPEKTANDTLTVSIVGGPADGSVITFTLTTSTSAVDSLLFVDANLDEAIYDYLRENKKETTYLARVPNILNITYSEIAACKELDLSNHDIQDLTGLASFANLTDLNLSQNKINNINELRYCTKMQQLNVSNTNIGNNNTAIESMTVLTNLDLSNTGMTHIDSINNLTNGFLSNKRTTKLLDLNISNNKISNIEGLENITTLQKLYVSSNQLTDISKLGSLAKLDTLNLSGNHVEDITSLEPLNNLKTLYISNNKIRDISPISRIAITELDFSGNRVKDITSLSRMTSLTNLYMNNNQIDNIESVAGLLIKNEFSVKQQKIVQVLPEEAEGTITVTLPQIFKSAKQSGSKVYTSLDFELKNCEWAGENTIRVNADELGDNIAMVIINGGNANATTLSIASPLKGTVSYSTEQWTNQDVVASIQFSRSNVTIINNNGNSSYTFEKNGTFTFEYIDEYGFEGATEANVTWIDKDGPQVEVSQGREGKSIVVTLVANEEIQPVEGWNMEQDKKTMHKTYTESTNETLTIKDVLGNPSNVEIAVVIDKAAPTITGVENGKTYLEPVTPVVEDENLETVTLKKNGQIVTGYQVGHAIEEPGQYELTATDSLENTVTISFVIEEVSVSDKITSTKYKVEEDNLYINKISPDTTLTQLKQNLHSEMTYQVLNQNGKVLSNTEKVGTGYKIKMQSGKVYTLIVMGDINGDARVSTLDASIIQKMHIKMMPNTGLEALAADMNGDGKLSTNDLAIMQKVLIKLIKI